MNLGFRKIKACWRAVGSGALLFLLAVLPVNAATLELRVVDETGVAIPCRVAARPRGKEGLVPAGATELRIGPERWFYMGGSATLDVPEGELELRVECGPEYVRVKRTLEIADPRTEHTIRLRRWIEMRERGYLCGDSHIHIAAEQLPPMLVAEGLDFGTVTTWWNGPDKKIAVPPGAGRSRNLTYAGRTIPASVHDAEVEHSWGAVFVQNLPAPFPLPSSPDRPNFDFVRHAREQGAMVHYQGGWSREAALDALAGYVNAVQLANNNFQPHRFQPRSRNSNLLQVEGFPVYPDTDEGMLQQSLDGYYRMLNWGLRLAASAGSSSDIKETPPGYNRAYVRVPRDATLDDFYRTWSGGKNFVTNGPMVFLKTSDGAEPGDTIRLPAGGGKVQLEVEVRSEAPLQSVEVVVNGKVAASLPITDTNGVAESIALTVTEGAWVALRSTARDELLADEELALYANGDKQQPSRLRFAHTSPIYVTVNGVDAFVPRSVEEGRKLLDRFEVYARANAGAAHLPELERRLQVARQALARPRPESTP